MKAYGVPSMMGPKLLFSPAAIKKKKGNAGQSFRNGLIGSCSNPRKAASRQLSGNPAIVATRR
jgi:hypothetical protein